mgnify:CR=1 FL=1
MNRFFIICTIVIIFTGCNNKTSSSKRSEAYYRGESVYRQVCISCHNIDPRKVGSLAPDIAGSTLEVVKSMIMTGKPPKGVDPKWPDKEMAALPNLEEKIPDIYEYLSSFK